MNNAFAGTYSDLRFVKSRKVAQVVIELPIEQANRFLQAFGAPDPSSESWVAIARLNHAPETEEAVEPEKPRRQWNDMRPSGRAALLCKETSFMAFLKVRSEKEAVEKLRSHCGVRSRSELDEDETKRMKFEFVERDFEKWREQKHF